MAARCLLLPAAKLCPSVPPYGLWTIVCAVRGSGTRRLATFHWFVQTAAQGTPGPVHRTPAFYRGCCYHCADHLPLRFFKIAAPRAYPLPGAARVLTVTARRLPLPGLDSLRLLITGLVTISPPPFYAADAEQNTRHWFRCLTPGRRFATRVVNYIPTAPPHLLSGTRRADLPPPRGHAVHVTRGLRVYSTRCHTFSRSVTGYPTHLSLLTDVAISAISHVILLPVVAVVVFRSFMGHDVAVWTAPSIRHSYQDSLCWTYYSL